MIRKQTKIKKKRRKKRFYKSGIHRSPKCPYPIHYRSAWEKETCKILDRDECVHCYLYEPFGIPYISNTKTNKVSMYYPDLLITYKDGSRRLVEIKRVDKLGDPIVQRKAQAAQQWAQKQIPKINYEFWTNSMIQTFKRINQIWDQQVKKKKK